MGLDGHPVVVAAVVEAAAAAAVVGASAVEEEHQAPLVMGIQSHQPSSPVSLHHCELVHRWSSEKMMRIKTMEGGGMGWGSQLYQQ